MIQDKQITAYTWAILINFNEVFYRVGFQPPPIKYFSTSSNNFSQI